ncbi:MAG: beta-lactamase family protein, partial [Acetobacteraceae bacterium]|nr:beta-lactamase family protein [Acetobacteraceae bacterium]
MRRPTGLTVLALALVLSPAAAQRVPPADNSPYARAIAAGYVAAMMCSGVFTAGRDATEVAADELAGIYPEYQPILRTLTAAKEPAAGRVTVPFDPELPPREAHWTPDAGCLTEPIGWTAPEGSRTFLPAKVAGPDPRPWPQGDAGIRPHPRAALAAAVAAAFDGRSYGAGKTIGLVIVRHGAVAAERYRTAPSPYTGWGPFVSNRTWSVGKSISGTLVGLAAAEGKVDVAKPAPVPEWRAGADDPRQAITLDNLLRMASGLHSGAAGNRTDAIYFGGTAVTEEATAWPLEAKPGTRFRYANDDVLLAVRSLRATLGEQAYTDFPAAALFRPL